MFRVFTFWVFVEVCDVFSLVRANCLGADAVAHHILLTVDLREGTIGVPLPVDLITVHLQNAHSQLWCFFKDVKEIFVYRAWYSKGT